MSAIEYVKGNSFFHRLDPRVKLFMVVFLTIFIFATKNFVVISFLFALICALWVISGISLKRIGGFFKLLIPLFAFVIIIQAIFQLGETVLIQPLIPSFIPLIGGVGRITLEGTLYGLILCYRILTLILLMPLITMTTEVNALALGLVKLGMPYKVAYMATTALNMIPSLQEQVKTIMDAQKLRGFTVFEEGSLPKKLKAYPTLVVPMVIGAMKKSMLIGVAMDARAFGSSKTRTYVRDLSFRWYDGVAVAFLLLFVGFLSLINLGLIF